MGPRQAYKVFIRFMLTEMAEERKVSLTKEQIEMFAEGVEDDITFYEKLEDFLAEYIEDFGENYDL